MIYNIPSLLLASGNLNYRLLDLISLLILENLVDASSLSSSFTILLLLLPPLPRLSPLHPAVLAVMGPATRPGVGFIEPKVEGVLLVLVGLVQQVRLSFF